MPTNSTPSVWFATVLTLRSDRLNIAAIQRQNEHMAPFKFFPSNRRPLRKPVTKSWVTLNAIFDKDLIHRWISSRCWSAPRSC